MLMPDSSGMPLLQLHVPAHPLPERCLPTARGPGMLAGKLSARLPQRLPRLPPASCCPWPCWTHTRSAWLSGKPATQGLPNPVHIKAIQQ